MLVHRNHLATYTPRTSLGEELYQSGRWVCNTVRVAGGSQLLHIVSVYGHPGANEGGTVMQENEILLQQVFDEAGSLGDVPVVLCGDFNVMPEKSNVISTELVTGRWLDAAAASARLDNATPACTYFSGGTSSRIDLVMLNNRAAQLFHRCDVCSLFRQAG